MTYFLKNIYHTLIILILLSNIVTAEDLSIKEKKWQKISDICSIKKLNITRKSSEINFDLIFIRFNPQKTSFKVLLSENYGLKICQASTFYQKSGAFCVINGGFFDENYNPLGVLIKNGKIIQYMPDAGNFSIFCIKYGKPIILHKTAFSYDGVTEAVQCSPRLFVGGSQTTGIYGADDVSRRSGIGVDLSGNIIIYATNSFIDGLSFKELINIFKKPQIKLQSVLNLDGGRSTQLYFNLLGCNINIPGIDKIPVGLGFFKK